MMFAHQRPFDSIHDRLPYQGTPDRLPGTWPGGTGVAVWVVPNVEHYEFLPLSTPADPWPRTPHPDARQYSYLDFGNRVGLWRLLDVVDCVGVPCTVSLNLAVLDHYPAIAEAIIRRDWDVMCHGVYNTRWVEGMSEQEESDLYGLCQEIARRHLGRPAGGLLGPFITANERTPDLLAVHGMEYHADWVHDDFPSPLRTRSGQLVALPYSYELNDGPLMRGHVEGPEYAARCMAQFDQLVSDHSRDGRPRLMCLPVHPFAMGQPHRIRHIATVLEHIASSGVGRFMTATQIVRHYHELAESVPTRSEEVP